MLAPSAVVAVVFQDKKHVLVVTRYHPKLIAFPGGGIDPGESPEQAVVRELYEETGVIVDGGPKGVGFVFQGPSKAIGRPFSYEKIVRAYFVPKWHGEPRQKEPGVEVKWVDWRTLCAPSVSPYVTFSHQVFIAMGLLKK